MIPEQNKETARWAVDYALKNGCQQAKVHTYSNTNSSFELRDGEIDRLQQAGESGMTISLYVNGRYGVYNTNRMEKTELERFISNGIDATKYLAEDKARVLPDASRYYKGGQPDLELYDSGIAEITPDDKVQIAKAAAEEVIGADKRIISVETSYDDGETSSYQLTSNGFEAESSSTWFSLYAGVSMRGEGDARPQSGWSETNLYFSDLKKTGVARKALERAQRKIGQKKIASGKYTMIVEPRNAPQLLSPLMNSLSGSLLQQNYSFLLNMMDRNVASDKITLLDRPHLSRSRGARYFDGEGVATKERTVLDKGVLRTFFIDTYNANKMNCEPTVESSSILVVERGEKSLEQLLKSVGDGILVTGFNGGNCNSSTGDFSYGVEGLLVHNGELVQPISEMNITGNMISLWNSLAEVGNDPIMTSSWRIPTLVFEGVDFSGL